MSTEPESLATIIAENQGLRASVAKYKRRAELANARADAAEVQAREAKAYADKITRMLTDARHRLQTALNSMTP